MKWFGRLFDAVVKKEVLELTYHHFGRKPRVRTVHPYQLRQEGNRWYVVGYEVRLHASLPLVVLALDRIDDVRNVDDNQLGPCE